MTHESAPLTLECRPDVARVVDRMRKWHDPDGSIRHLVTVIPSTWNSFNWDLSIGVPTPRPLDECDFGDEGQLCDHLDFRIGRFEHYWAEKRAWRLDDDMVPVFEPRLGWAEAAAAAVADSEIRYYAQTSNLEPVIADYDSFDWGRIGLQPDSPAGKVLTRMNTYSLERAKGRFLVMPRGEMLNPSDLAKACRGDELFTDVVTTPEMVHKLMACCLSACISLVEYVRGLAGQTTGGYVCSWHGGYWTPGTILGHSGDNVADLISGSMYEQFVFPYCQQFGRHFDGLVFARDVSSKHLWPILRKLGIIKALKPRDVGHVVVTPEHVYEIAEATDGMPLFLEVHRYDDLGAYTKAVADTGIKATFVVHCADREQGQRAVDRVRLIG